jgi:hypothetical protein
MRKLTSSEVLSLSSLLQMEANSLAVSKAAVHALTDEELLALTKAGIMASEARIKGFQQFISENQIV